MAASMKSHLAARWLTIRRVTFTFLFAATSIPKLVNVVAAGRGLLSPRTETLVGNVDESPQLEYGIFTVIDL